MQSKGEARRFCDVCVKQVHDISAMTERRARETIHAESAKGRVCVRYKADSAGNIQFKAAVIQTVSAPSFWRASLAAAGMSLMLMTGCADTQPTEVNAERCVYEVGPWSFTAARGEGSCPELEEEQHNEVVGEFAIEPPHPPIQGKIGETEELPLQEELGELSIVDPADPDDPLLLPVEDALGWVGPIEEPAGTFVEPCDPGRDKG